MQMQQYSLRYELILLGTVDWVTEVRLGKDEPFFSLGITKSLVTLLKEGRGEVELIPRLGIEGPNWDGFYYPTLNAAVALNPGTGVVIPLSPSPDWVFIDPSTKKEYQTLSFNNKKIQLKDLTEHQSLDLRLEN